MPATQRYSQCCGAGSSSSSSPVVNNLLLKKIVFTKINSQFTGPCFIQRKVLVLCFALPVLYRDRLILFYIIVNNFGYFFSLNLRSELKLELEPEPPIFSRLRPKRAAPAPQHWVLVLEVLMHTWGCQSSPYLNSQAVVHPGYSAAYWYLYSRMPAIQKFLYSNM